VAAAGVVVVGFVDVIGAGAEAGDEPEPASAEVELGSAPVCPAAVAARAGSAPHHPHREAWTGLSGSGSSELNHRSAQRQGWKKTAEADLVNLSGRKICRTLEGTKSVGVRVDEGVDSGTDLTWTDSVLWILRKMMVVAIVQTEAAPTGLHPAAADH